MNFYSEYEYWVTIINSVVSDSTDISLCLQVSSCVYKDFQLF